MNTNKTQITYVTSLEKFNKFLVDPTKNVNILLFIVSFISLYLKEIYIIYYIFCM